MKLVNGERLDVKGKPLVNCSGCKWKVGKVCAYFHAFLQTNPHKPTDCEHWESKEHKGL